MHSKQLQVALLKEPTRGHSGGLTENLQGVTRP